MWDLDHKKSWTPKNWCVWTVVLKKTLESPLDCKEIQLIHPKGNQSWIFTGRTDAEAETPNTLATWCLNVTHLKKPWCWERLKARREGDDRGQNDWMASLNQWTGVWVSSMCWWWTGKPGVLQSMGSQKSMCIFFNYLSNNLAESLTIFWFWINVRIASSNFLIIYFFISS